MLNIEFYKKQLSDCKTEEELWQFVARYKKQNESVLDWLARPVNIEPDQVVIHSKEDFKTNTIEIKNLMNLGFKAELIED